MFRYNLKLALLNLRHRMDLTFLMIMLIAIGIGAMMTFYSVIHNLSKDPIPGKSKHIFLVQFERYFPDEPPLLDLRDFSRVHTYQDAMYLYSTDTPATQHVMYFETDLVADQETDIAPLTLLRGGATTGTFFDTFEVPFQYGGAWDKAIDEAGSPVIVLSQLTNERLFNGRNSVGQQLKINETYVTVVGVLDKWPVPLRYYDGTMDPDHKYKAFVPFHLAINSQFERDRYTTGCNFDEEGLLGTFNHEYHYESLIHSNCTWITLWTVLESEAQVRAYQEFVKHYLQEQERLGRYLRYWNDSVVTNLIIFMKAHTSIVEAFQVFVVITFFFFMVCLANTISLILTKLLRHSKEMALRRALGATQKMILIQNMIETGIIGGLGGILGLVSTHLGLWGMKMMLVSNFNTPDPLFDDQFGYDAWVMLLTVVLSIIGTMIAGAYPVWRVCRQSPAIELKL